MKDLTPDFIKTGTRPVFSWLGDSRVDVAEIAEAAGLSPSRFGDVLISLEARGLAWVEKGFDTTGRRTDRLRVRVEKAETLTDEERRIIEGISRTRPTSGKLPDGWVREQKGAGAVRENQHITTPQGNLVVARVVAESLLRNGAIVGELDGELRANDAAALKAAVLAAAICDFCSAPGASHVFNVPDPEILRVKDQKILSAGKGLVGWAACDECNALIREDRRKALLERAIKALAFAKWTRGAIEEMFNRFWRAMEAKADTAGSAAALADFLAGNWAGFLKQAEPGDAEKAKQADRAGVAARRTFIGRDLDLSVEQVLALSKGEILDDDALVKIARWNARVPKAGRDATLLQAAGIRPPAPLDLVPHWQQALDAKHAASRDLKTVTGAASTFFSPEFTDLKDMAAVAQMAKLAESYRQVKAFDLEGDAKLLAAAEAYSFNADTADAIRLAGEKIPHDSPLSSVDVPTGAGWFWFAAPQPWASVPTLGPVTHAMLWGWTDRFGPVSLQFSTYVRDKEGRVVPATRWYWPLTDTFHEMIARATAEYRLSYGPGGRYEGMAESGEEATIRVIADASVFFLAACVWFKQKIVVASEGHIERHARKRMMREQKLSEPPKVRVIALRASEKKRSGEPAGEGGEGTGRHLTCRFVVAGHPRLQRCGPGRKDVKLIWIDPYPKGPEDAPFRTREKVYAVIR